MIGLSIAANSRRSHDPMSRVAGVRPVPGDSCAMGATRFYGFDDTESHRIGDRPANRAANPGILAGRFPAVLHRTGLEPYPGAGRQRRPGTWQAHRHPGAARHGAGGQTRLRPLPRSAQPGTLGRPRRGTSIVAASLGGAVAQRRGGDRHRRHDRATLGRENQGTRHLSRRGALVARPLRQDQRIALVVARGDAAVPFAGRRWALPFLTVLAPSARWSEAQGRRHKALTEWARQAILQTKRWLPDRRMVVVADSGFSALELIAAVRRHVCLITRLRLDASLFEPAPKRRKG